MAENARRGLFTLSGISGMLIATVLLLVILAGLTFWGILVQQSSAQHPYDPTPITSNLDNVKMNSVDNAQHAFKDAN
jgi:CHASE3 domain sensor protein